MGKKIHDGNESSGTRKKTRREPFVFLNTTFEKIDKTTVFKHIFLLVIATIAAKLLVAFVTENVFHSFVDQFDITYYLQSMGIPLLQGKIPYISFEFAYPILFIIPVVIAMIPAILTNNAVAFIFTFQALMVICDIVTILCVYLIALKLGNERIAFYTGLLYAAAFSSAYFVITKFDACPTSFLMLAILFTIYGNGMKGYIASVIGFFAKIFPILALPFLILYNSKRTSLKQEIIQATKVVLPISAVLFLPFFVLNPISTIKMFIPVRTEIDYYSNTPTFTIYSWIHDVLMIGISLDTISVIMYICMGIGLLGLLYAAYTIPDRDPILLIKLILCAIILVVVSARVRSPQYIVWFTPLLCILAIDDIKKIAALFAFQALAYIEFPLMFGAFYSAVKYTNPALSTGWIITLVVFTLEYLTLFVCLWLVVNPVDIYHRVRQSTGKLVEPEKKTVYE